MSPINRNTLGLRINTRLAGYAALAGAALAVPAAADASIVYSGVVNITIPSNTDGVYLNVVTGANSGTVALAPGWDVNPFSSSGLSFFNPTTPAGGVYVQRTGGGATANLPVGTLIDAASVYGSSAAATTGAQPFVLSSSTNYVGFRFTGEDALVHYGWMQISVSTTLAGQPRLIVSYAYEDVAGVGILAGAVPEPSTFALLGVMAAGALGVRVWRKRKAV